MSYLNINLDNLSELKSRRGNSTTGLIATILGLNYPVAEAWSVYLWVDSSTAVTDDVEVVGSLLGDPNVGRWIRIDLAQTPQVNADWTATSGPSMVMNKPTSFTPSAHTHPSTEISDSTATGRALIAALDAAAGRAAIGAAATAHSQPWTTITATPTTLAGYGITDASNGKAVVGTTVKSGSFRIYKNATVASGVAVFNLTDDGLSTGNALYSEVFADSVQPIISDATASYQFSWAFSNSNKTLTVTANKLTTANILTGLLGQAPANGAVVKLIVEGK